MSRSWPALVLKLDGQDYATINPNALISGDAALAELTIPLPRLPDGRPRSVAVADAATGAIAPGSYLLDRPRHVAGGQVVQEHAVGDLPGQPQHLRIERADDDLRIRRSNPTERGHLHSAA